MPTALMYAAQILGMLPSLISAGKNITDLVTTGNAALKSMQDEKRDPTPAEWDALNAQITALRAELHSAP
jgi:hypothetical protein